MKELIKKELLNAENNISDYILKHNAKDLLMILGKITALRVEITGHEKDWRNETKGCLRCALKSLMNSKIFLKDQPGFSEGSYNQLILDLAEYLQRNMPRA